MYTKEQLDTIVRDEQELCFPEFYRNDAIRLAMLVYETAVAEKLGICCQVVLNELSVIRFFLDGTDESNMVWLDRKKNAVLKSGGWSSLRCGMEAEINNIHQDWHLDTENYVIRGGGVPIRDTNGTLLGALCISGLVHLEDHALCVRVLRAYLKQKETGKV